MSSNTATFTNGAERPDYGIHPTRPERPAPRRVPVDCPNCRVNEQVDAHAMVAVCAACRRSIRCIMCAGCGHCFATSEHRKLQCPRCLYRLRTWKGSDVPFEGLATQRRTGVEPVDVHWAAGTSLGSPPWSAAAPAPAPAPAPASEPEPESEPGSNRESEVRAESGSQPSDRTWRTVAAGWVLGLAIVLALGAAGMAVARTARGSNAAPCPLARARTTLTSTVTRDARGDLHLTAVGTTVNESSRALHHVVVTWVVLYADGSVGRTTATSIPGLGHLAKGGASSWSASPSSRDGLVRPTGVRVLQTYRAAAHPTCLL